MSSWQSQKLDAWVNSGAIELGRGDIISKDDITAHPGPYPIYSSSAQNNGKFGEYAKFMFEEELITWSVDGGGNFFYRPKHRFSVTNVSGYMRIKSRELHAPFIYYCLADQHKRLTFDYTTKAHPSVIRKLYSLPKVEPAVQRKVARILQTVEASIEATEALIAKYQQIKAGLMHDLFTRGIGADGKLRPPREQAPELYQHTPIGWIPKEWGYNSLRGIFGASNIVNGPFGSDLLTSELKKEGVPVIYCQDIKPGYFKRVSSSNVTQIKAAQLAFCNVRAKDILLAKVGSPPCDSCVYDRPMNAIVTQDVIRIRPSSELESGYFSSWFNSSYGRKAIKRISIEGTRERVSLGEFKDLIIPLPSKDEQKIIGQRINHAQTTIAKEMGYLKKLTTEKSGLMHDLLTGKVRVKLSEASPEMAGG